MKDKDALGMSQQISRRQFINGFACSVGAAALSSALPAMALTNPAQTLYYPSKLTGMAARTPALLRRRTALSEKANRLPRLTKSPVSMI